MDAESIFVIPRKREGQVISEKRTAKEMIEELAEDFFLNQKDIEYIISRVQKVPSSWKNLLGSLFLFTRCQRSKVPPVSYRLFCQKLEVKGYKVDIKTVKHAVRYLRDKGIYPRYCPLSTIDLFGSYAPFIKRELSLSDEVVEKTKVTLQKIKEEGLDIGKNPVTVIFSALYISAILCDEHRTQKEITDVGDFSEVTLSYSYKKLLKQEIFSQIEIERVYGRTLININD